MLLDGHRGAVVYRVLHLAPHDVEVGLTGEAEQHPGTVLARGDVVRLVLGVGPAEHLPHIPLPRVEVQGQVAAAHRVQVVEPDREGGTEGTVHVHTEHVLGVGDAQQLEGDFDLGRVLVTDHDPRFGRDQLVAQGRVARLRGEAEFTRCPLATPRGGVEVRTGTDRAPGQVCQRAAQCGAVQCGRDVRVLYVDPAVDPSGDRVAVPVQYGPVGVEQAHQVARDGGAPQVDADGQLALGHGRLGVPLRQVRVPQQIRPAQ